MHTKRANGAWTTGGTVRPSNWRRSSLPMDSSSRKVPMVAIAAAGAPSPLVGTTPAFAAHELAETDASQESFEQFASRPEAQFEILRSPDSPYLGFRSLVAGARLLQARRRGPNRLVFFNSSFGVNEQWMVVDLRRVPAEAADGREMLEARVVPRQLPAFEVKVRGPAEPLLGKCSRARC